MTKATVAAFVLATERVCAYAPASLLVHKIRHASYCNSWASVHPRRCRLNMVGVDAAFPSNTKDGTQSEFSASAELDTGSSHSQQYLQIDVADNSFGSYSSSQTDTDRTQPVLQLKTSNQLTQQPTPSWKDRLIDVSNIASFLCVLDCTLLPLVSIALPALSWIAGGVSIGSNNNVVLAGFSSMADFLPALGHGIALFFVIPVGLLTTIVNYFFGHKQWRFSVASLFGMMLIYAANSNSGVGIASVDSFLTSWGIASHSHGGHVHDACGAIVGATTGMLTHSCGEGWAHRLTNTLGCAFLLGSNHYGKKYMEKQSKGCAASVLAEAWGGNDPGRRPVCPPGCGCEQPSYGASRVSTNAQSGGDMFFSWDKASGGDKRGRSQVDTGSRSSRFRRFRQ
jgi:hypothetical protein